MLTNDGETKSTKGIKNSGDIEEALNNKETLLYFTLYGKELKEIDSRIGQLKNLKELYLGKNYFSSIPSEIFQLEELEQLLLYNNKLKVIPKEIGNLSNLKILKLHDNEIEVLPDEISKIKGLILIDLTGNPLKKGEIEKLKKLLPHCHIKF